MVMKVANRALDELGRFLMQDVRDRAIRRWRLTLEGRMHGEGDAALVTVRASPECREAVGTLVPMIVDDVLHALLFGIQESQDIKLLVSINGEAVNVADVSDGLQGEPWSSRGWIARFSAYKEPADAI